MNNEFVTNKDEELIDPNIDNRDDVNMSKPILDNQLYEVARPDINISFDQISENVAILRKAIDTLKNSWNKETKNNINKLNSSWVGSDCAEFIDKLLEMDKPIQNTIAALELLCSTYEKAKEMIQDNQSGTASAIRNI